MPRAITHTHDAWTPRKMAARQAIMFRPPVAYYGRHTLTRRLATLFDIWQGRPG